MTEEQIISQVSRATVRRQIILPRREARAVLDAVEAAGGSYLMMPALGDCLRILIIGALPHHHAAFVVAPTTGREIVRTMLAQPDVRRGGGWADDWVPSYGRVR